MRRKFKHKTLERRFRTVKIWTWALIALLFHACGMPKASFDHQKAIYQAPAYVEFKNTSTPADRYEWDFGDGITSDTLQTAHQYQSSGNYLVTLKAIKGSKESISQKYIAVRAPESCTVVLETEYGDMQIELYNETPRHRDNFIKLIQSGFYHDLLFHRVVPGFVIQGGDPKSRNATPGKRIGSSGPGYTIPAEFTPERVHIRGALAAARDDNPDKASSGSQFYLVQGSRCTEEQLSQQEDAKSFNYSPEQKRLYLEQGGSPQLDMEYTVFGRVVSGLEVMDKISTVETNNDRPQKNVTMRFYVLE